MDTFKRMKDIKLIAYDFDGVMTDDHVLLSEDGKEYVIVNRKDGLAVQLIKNLGIKQIVISTESNPIVAIRARKLGIPCIHNTKNKLSALEEYLKKQGISIRTVLFLGNDINDLEVMSRVGLAACPSDANPKIKKIAHLRLFAHGGGGVVRELYDLISESSL